MRYRDIIAQRAARGDNGKHFGVPRLLHPKCDRGYRRAERRQQAERIFPCQASGGSIQHKIQDEQPLVFFIFARRVIERDRSADAKRAGCRRRKCRKDQIMRKPANVLNAFKDQQLAPFFSGIDDQRAADRASAENLCYPSHTVTQPSVPCALSYIFSKI